MTRRPTARAATAVALVATVIQIALVAFFVALALSGDGLGIALALAFGFTGPLILLTLPAILLLRAGHVRPAALLACGSLVVSVLLWRFA